MLKFYCILWCAFALFVSRQASAEDPLPSWREGSAKQAILAFVATATDQSSTNFIPPEDRIAAFDNDGTLWVEQPLYTEFVFSFDAIVEQAAQHPAWRHQEPFKSILACGQQAIANLSMRDVVEVIDATHSGMTINAFHQKVSAWLKRSLHPRFKRPYTDLVYKPMLEVMQLLRTHGFQVYIVSGGGQEFMRAFTKELYGVPSGRVIGTAGKVKYEYQNGQPILFKLPELMFVNDKEGKPEGINLVIGQRPVIAFGNSIGDQQMLEWTQAGVGKTLELLVHHDDAEREYVYGPNSKVGTFSVALMDEAKQRGWIVVSMKNDWKVIFPWE